MARKLGDILLDEGIISSKTLERALKRQKNDENGKKIGIILLEMYVVTNEELDAALNKQQSPFSDVEGKKRLGDILVNFGLISRNTLEKALVVQKRNGKKLGEVLEDMNVVTEYELVEFLGKQCSLHVIGEFAHKEFNKDMLELLPAEFVIRKMVFPVSQVSNQLAVAIYDPFDGETIEFISRLTGMIIIPVLAARSHILAAIAKHYSQYGGLTQRADVLFVEGDDDIAKTVRKSLEEKGLRVVRVTNANDAVSKMEDVRPKYILADESSCGLSPEHFINSIKGYIDGTKTYTCLYMSKINLKSELAYMNAGFHEIQIKPYHPERIAMCIAHRIEKM